MKLYYIYIDVLFEHRERDTAHILESNKYGQPRVSGCASGIASLQLPISVIGNRCPKWVVPKPAESLSRRRNQQRTWLALYRVKRQNLGSSQLGFVDLAEMQPSCSTCTGLHRS